MLKLKDILRLHHEAQLSYRQIARSLGLSLGVISKYLTRARLADIKWPLPPEVGEQQLLAILQPKRNGSVTALLCEPDFAQIAVELSRKGMTRQLLWEEYAEQHPNNHYSYSRFAVLYRAWLKKQRISMRQTHTAGEKLFVDYAGLTLKIIDSRNGEERPAQVFVSVLGASSYTYAEAGVQIVERWIMMRLRKLQLFTLADANSAIRALLDDLNNRPFKQRPGSRRSQFEAIDKSALKPLPKTPYTYRHIIKARAHIDYHVSYEGHHYSVPYKLRGEQVMLHVGEHCIDVFYQGKGVAQHPRAVSGQGGHTTNVTHMPKAHAKHQEWTPSRFLNWASQVGPATERVVRYQLQSRPHPEHGYRACLGILNLAKKYGNPRLENACLRAEKIGGLHYKNLASILKTSLDKLPIETDKQKTLPFTHSNVRGSDYYH